MLVMNTPAQTEQISVTVQFGWGYSRSAGYGRPPLSAYLSAWTAMPLFHQTCVSTGPSVPLPAAPRTPHRVSSCSDVPVPEASPVSGSTRLFPLSDTHIPPVKWLPSPGCLSHDFFHFSWVNYTIFELESPVFPGFSAILPPK